MKSAEELLAEYIEIRSPKVLYSVVDSLKDFINQGLLKEISGTCSIFEIQEGKPFPDDLINIEFKTQPGSTKYLLSCETYHGVGGVFKKLC